MSAKHHPIEVHDLLGPLFAECAGMRVGWPDDVVQVELADIDGFRAAFRRLFADLRAYWEGCSFFADVDVYAEQRRFDVRVARLLPTEERGGFDEAAAARARAVLEPGTAALERCVKASGGTTERGWHGTYFDVKLPVASWGPELATRTSFPRFEETDWDDSYRAKLARLSWTSLRHEAYRFCHLASCIADWGKFNGKRDVLIPSVGLCAHPWLFAARSLRVVATDYSRTALDVLAHPERLPRVYGVAAKERWDLSQSATYGGGHPDAFAPMPQIDQPEVAADLRSHIDFVACDWAATPLPDASVDIVFATNALPRDDEELRRRVMSDWLRVLRPSGLVFSAMHNDGGETLGMFCERLGVRHIDALRGESPNHEMAFQEYQSSG